MKKFAILVFVCLFLLGCNLPFTISMKTAEPTTAETEVITEAVPATQAVTEAPAATVTEAVTPEPLNGTELNLGGVYMVLPPCLATGATGTIIAAVPYDEMNGPMEYYPQNRKISFQGYPLSGKFFTVDDPDKTGGLVIYPVADFVAMNDSIGDRVSEMQNLLATQPAAPDGIPLLPIFNAAQIYHMQIKYLNFQNGQGVRFLTVYGQYYAPVSNHDLIYAFQGLTTDGKYWVSAIMPINAAYLQEDSESTSVPAGGILAPGFSDPNYEQNMAIYGPQITEKINTTPNTDFTPTLDCLDGFFQSLSIGD